MKMRNPSTNRLRKKTRRSTTRKRRSAFASTPMERLFTKYVFLGVSYFAGMTHLFLLLFICVLMSNNAQLAMHFLNCSRLCFYAPQLLINTESVIGDAHIDLDTHRLFVTPLAVLRISNFQNDDYCESWTHFTKGELNNLIRRLRLEEHVRVENTPGYFCVCRQKELFACAISKLDHGLPHSVMADMVVGGD